MLEVLPGVWWLHGTRGCNVYVARADDGSLSLVDVGFALNERAIRSELEQLPGREKISRILLTHRHFDHSGAAAAIARETGAAIVAGRADTLLRSNGERRLRDDRLRSPKVVRRLLRWAMRIREHDEPIPVTLPVNGPCEIAPGLFALPVPGHTAGTCVYFLRRADACFVGDLCISYRDGLHRAMAAANDNDAQYLETLREFAGRAPNNGFPGHGLPVLGNFRTELTGLANRPRNRAKSPRKYLRQARRMREFFRLLFGEQRSSAVRRSPEVGPSTRA